MRKLMMIGLAIVSLTFAGNVQAQNKRWSLQECIDHAIRHNIEVKQSRNRIEKLKVEKSTLKKQLPARPQCRNFSEVRLRTLAQPQQRIRRQQYTKFLLLRKHRNASFYRFQAECIRITQQVRPDGSRS